MPLVRPTASPAPPPPPLPPDTLERALLFGIGAGVPMLAMLALGEPRGALFAGMGAVMALQADPRRSTLVRVVAVLAAMLLILGAGILGIALQRHDFAVAATVVGITFLAGLPKPYFPYLSMVGKVCAAVVIVTSAGFAATIVAAQAFAGGGMFALLVLVLTSQWRDTQATGISPAGEVTALLAGERNPLFYAMTLACAVALALLLAETLHAQLPGWVGLTVLFVMHPDDATALKLMAQRIGGTLAGVVVAGIVVHAFHDAWTLVGLAIALAALLPKATATNYFWMSGTFTLLVLLLLDLALLAQGGDAPLLLWRLYDTLLGCAVAGSVLLAVAGSRRWRARRHRDGSAEADPPDAPESTTPGDGGQA